MLKFMLTSDLVEFYNRLLVKQSLAFGEYCFHWNLLPGGNVGCALQIHSTLGSSFLLDCPWARHVEYLAIVPIAS